MNYYDRPMHTYDCDRCGQIWDDEHIRITYDEKICKECINKEEDIHYRTIDLIEEIESYTLKINEAVKEIKEINTPEKTKEILQKINMT